MIILNKLLEIVSYACENVDFYRNKSDLYKLNDVSEFRNIPLLTKNDIQNNINEFLSNEYDFSSLIKENTSGSSGKTLTIYKDVSERVKADMQLWKRRKIYYADIFKIPIVKFYAYRRKKDKLVSESIYIDGKEINFSLFDLSDEQLFKYVEVIKGLEKCWFFAAPSVMLIFANFLSRHKISLNNVVLIELTGEMVTKKQEEYISKNFNCKCVNHYGSREFWGIAYECPCGNLHVFDDYVYAEVIDEDGKNLEYEQEGYLCYTGLEKYAMPLIRYLQGDIGYLKKSACACGSTADILCLSGGRVTDYITTVKGETVNSMLLFYIIELINFERIKILQFQFIQNNIDNFFASIVLVDKKESERLVSEQLRSLLSKYLKSDVELKVDFVSAVEFDKISNKHKYFINHTNKSIPS